MDRAARMNAPQATRDSAEPIEIRRTPASRSFATVRSGLGVETRTFTGLGKERKIPGWVDNPRPNKQNFKMMVTRNSAKIYQIICTCDEDDFSKYEAEFDEMLGSFQVTGA